MSEISTRLRNYVNDPDVAIHYGIWGILRREQRRQIRQLCDTCDMFEHAADAMCMEIEELKSKNSNLTSDLTSARAEIERYEKIVGKLAINKDGIAIGTLNGKQTEYIQKSVAEVFRNMAVNRAKAEAVKEFAKMLNEASEDTWIDREGDFIYSDSEKSTHEIYYTLAEWCKDVTDNLIKELTEGSDNDGGS